LQDEQEDADSVVFTHYPPPITFEFPECGRGFLIQKAPGPATHRAICKPVCEWLEEKKGSVCHLDIFKENAFHHEGHEGHEEVAIRFIAHRGTEEGMQS
jgi:hypothetical protein